MSLWYCSNIHQRRHREETRRHTTSCYYIILPYLTFGDEREVTMELSKQRTKLKKSSLFYPARRFLPVSLSCAHSLYLIHWFIESPRLQKFVKWTTATARKIVVIIIITITITITITVAVYFTDSGKFVRPAFLTKKPSLIIYCIDNRKRV